MSFRPPTVGQIGERGLIERLRSICEEVTSPETIVGIGDDTAVLRLDDERALLATSDIQVEGVHFRRELITLYQLGRRVIAVNLSDIASMGGSAHHGLVSLVLPSDTTAEEFDAIFEGARDQAMDFGASIVGGNLAAGDDKLIIDVFMLGKVRLEHLMTRAGAGPGDGVYVTGTIGSSSAGLEVLARHGPACPDDVAALAAAHLQPRPRVTEGAAIAESGAATAMIDISDGLAADLKQVCEQSRVGCEIHRGDIPLAPSIERVSSFSGKEPWRYALHGGEDYELLFTVRPDADETIRRIADDLRTPMTRIGTVVARDAGLSLVEPDGRRGPLEARGWDHFPAGGAGR
jgi:thiamine-monophosphate kinase